MQNSSRDCVLLLRFRAASPQKGYRVLGKRAAGSIIKTGAMDRSAVSVDGGNDVKKASK